MEMKAGRQDEQTLKKILMSVLLVVL
jgi:hypothetical protein